ncbi:hypothetical protein BJX65DRAFT_311729 [Aspergillus insuetus]
MHHPASIISKAAHGSWVMDKALSTDSDPILKLQGVGWVTRKGISMATITIRIKSSSEMDHESQADVNRLDIEQTLSAVLPGSTETRILNWTERKQKDPLFGILRGRSRLVGGTRDDDGIVRPAIEIESTLTDEKAKSVIRDFLRDFTTAASHDNLSDLYMHDYVRSEKAGWTVEQTWGISSVDSQEALVRRVVLVKDNTHETAVVVYRNTFSS